MEQIKTLIFVDSDDTCRAAMIKILMSKKVLYRPLEIKSRGLVVLFSEPLDAKAYAVLNEKGYGWCLEHKAEQLLQEDIGDDVLLLTMEDKQKIRIWEQFENARNVYTLAEYIHYNGDILPLYGEPLSSYEEWIAGMDVMLDELVLRLNGQEALLPYQADGPEEAMPEDTMIKEDVADDGEA